MTTTGTYAWSPVADDLLLEAWERLGKSEAELTGAIARSARNSLQYMAVDWTNRGLNLWQVDKQSFSTVVGTANYTLATATVEPLDLYVTVGGVDRICKPIGRETYAGFPLKTTQAPPTQYWTDRVTGAPVLYLYPTPDQVYTVTYWRMRMPMDVGPLGYNLDAPTLWADAISAELAARLAEKYAPDRQAEKRSTADKAFGIAAGENRNRVPMTIAVATGWGRR